jgi:hypothetical protein
MPSSTRAVRATAHRRENAAGSRTTVSSRLSRVLSGDYTPVFVLTAVMLALGAYVLSTNSRYLSDFNITSVMTSCAALGFIALGQTIALLVGGIDLSVGPLAGFMVVIGSFFLNDAKAAPTMVLGLLLMLLAGIGTGAVNGALIRYAKFTPVAATLATYIALQGLSFLLRDAPGATSPRRSPISSPRKSARCPSHSSSWCWPPSPSRSGFAAAEWGSGYGPSDRRGGRPSGRRQGHAYRDRCLHRVLRAGLSGRHRAAGSVGHRRSGAGHRLHAQQHHRGRHRRHQPPRRPRHLHRDPARRRPHRPGAQRHRVPRSHPDLAVLLQGALVVVAAVIYTTARGSGRV